MSARALTVAALLAGAAACNSEAETFSLRLTWSQTGAYACPTGGDEVASCADIDVTCRAKLLIRILPLDGGDPYYRHCYDLPSTLDACAVNDLDIVPSNPIPNENVRLQVALWSADQLDGELEMNSDGCPPDVAFDELGMPRIDTMLVPALGGEIYFPVGDRHVAEVELGCPQYDLLDTVDCRLGEPVIEAVVLAPGSSWARVTDEDALVARFGKPTPDLLDGWKLAAADLDPLTYRGGGEPVWSGQLTHELPELGCLDLDPSEPSSTRIAVCEPMPEVFTGEPITIEGYLIDNDTVDDALRALGLGGFPAEGLVLGMVIDHQRQPVAGARVTAAGATILYPNAQFTGVNLDKTSSNGLFLSTDAKPPDTRWEASGENGVGSLRPRYGGVIVNHVTVVVLQLNPPIGGQP